MRSQSKLRKGESSSTGIQFLIVIAVLVLFAITYFFFLGNFKSISKGLTDYKICEASNLENAEARIKLDNQVIASRTGNHCATEYIVVEEGEELETIAKKMRLCWDMYLKGEHEIFETEDGTFCAFCSVLEFEDKTEIQGLSAYLMETEIPGKGGLRYHEYLTRSIVTNDQIERLKNSEWADQDKVDTNNDYAVIFVMGKDANPGSWTGESSVYNSPVVGVGARAAIIGTLRIVFGVGLCLTGIGCGPGAFIVTAGGAAGGYLIGSDESATIDSRILFWPYTQEALSNLDCTQLEGRDTLEIRK